MVKLTPLTILAFLAAVTLFAMALKVVYGPAKVQPRDPARMNPCQLAEELCRNGTIDMIASYDECQRALDAHSGVEDVCRRASKIGESVSNTCRLAVEECHDYNARSR